MEDFSLYMLDIVNNSVRAGASQIDIELDEHDKWLDFTVTDNGCGMTEQQVANLADPFFTTRKTRNVGLGIPFFKMLAEMTGGWIKITSTHESLSSDHGTVLRARFGRDHIDFVPLGDLVSSFVTLIHGSPLVDFTYVHKKDGREAAISCAEIRTILGDEISLNEPEVLSWIEQNLREQYSDNLN